MFVLLVYNKVYSLYFRIESINPGSGIRIANQLNHQTSRPGVAHLVISISIKLNVYAIFACSCCFRNVIRNSDFSVYVYVSLSFYDSLVKSQNTFIKLCGLFISYDYS